MTKSQLDEAAARLRRALKILEKRNPSWKELDDASSQCVSAERLILKHIDNKD